MYQFKPPPPSRLLALRQVMNYNQYINFAILSALENELRHKSLTLTISITLAL